MAQPSVFGSQPKLYLSAVGLVPLCLFKDPCGVINKALEMVFLLLL